MHPQNDSAGLLLASAIHAKLKAFGSPKLYSAARSRHCPPAGAGAAPAGHELSAQRAARQGDRDGRAVAAHVRQRRCNARTGRPGVSCQRQPESGRHLLRQGGGARSKRRSHADGSCAQSSCAGKDGRRVRELEQAAATAADDRATVALIVAALQKRDYDRASRRSTRSRRSRTEQAGRAYPSGQRPPGQGRRCRGSRSFERALSIDPASFLATLNLARLDLIEKKPEAAQQRFEALLKVNPKSVESLLALAELRSRARALPRRSPLSSPGPSRSIPHPPLPGWPW